MAATAARTFTDRPRWLKDIAPLLSERAILSDRIIIPLVETAAWIRGKNPSRSTPERHAILHVEMSYANRRPHRLARMILGRYLAVLRRNIGGIRSKSIRIARPAPKSLMFSDKWQTCRAGAAGLSTGRTGCFRQPASSGTPPQAVAVPRYLNGVAATGRNCARQAS